jgi:hypothetical protein
MNEQQELREQQKQRERRWRTQLELALESTAKLEQAAESTELK